MRTAKTLLLSLAVVCCAHEASAAGLFFSDRGVRPLARGGAFVAGADDIGAMWYNPAGLSYAGSSIMADFSWLNFSSSYTRRTQVVDASGVARVYEYPKVTGTTPFLPIPTIGGSYNFGKNKEFTLAAGILAPYTAIATYPLNVNGAASPSRYSLVSLDGSLLVVGGVFFAYKPIEELRFGIGIQALAGNFNSTVVFSANPADRLIGAPEDPQYDSLSQLKVGPIFSPSANLGVTGEPDKHFRLGLSGQLPFVVDAPAKVSVRLPTAAPFDNASQVGTDAHVKFTMPAILRAGIEYRTVVGDGNFLRVEAAFVHEFWSAHKTIDVVPDNMSLVNVTGFPSPFKVAPLSIQRNFEDSNSFRLGAEYKTKGLITNYPVDIRGGLNYETSAVPAEYLSPLTVDMNKVTLAAGGGIHIQEHWRLDATMALVLANDVTVDPAQAKLPRINPVAGNAVANPETINGGTYTASAFIFGVGANYKF